MIRRCRTAAWAAATAVVLGVSAGAGAQTDASGPPASTPPPVVVDRIATIDRCTRLIVEGEYAKARTRLTELLAVSPDDARATFLLAMTHHRERNYAAAEPLMVRALELDPTDFVVHHFLGWARLHLGDLEGAGQSFERHWVLQPGEPDTIFGLGLVALESGYAELAERRFREAIGHIRSFEASDPVRWNARRRDLGKCHARLGEIAFARGDHDSARRSLERALSIDPGQTTAWFVLSRVQRRLGDDRKADIAMARFEAAVGRRGPDTFRADDPANADGDATADPPAAVVDEVPEPPTDAVTADSMPPVPDDAPAFAFTDVTNASGIDLVTTNGDDPATAIVEVKAGGLALLDHDGDGDLDILVPNGATLDTPNAGAGARLFENLGGMRFRDATAEAGLADVRPWAMGVATGDVNGDGHVDVFLACLGRDRLLLGSADGRFTDATEAAGVGAPSWSTAASFGDIDGDGDLDLLVVGYVDLDPANPPPPSSFRGLAVPAGPRGLPAVPDTLYENLGDGTFRDISVPSGLRRPETGYGLAAAIADFDADGVPDLFVGNDSMPNRLLRRSDDGGFRDDGLRSGIAISGDGSPRATMGLAVGDLDDDGRMDVLTTNFAGEPNTVHALTADGFHDDVTTRLALAADSRSFLGWGCAIEDLDHDGHVDVLVVNGHVYPGATRATMLADERQPPLLMRRADDAGPVRYERVPPPASESPDDPRAWLGAAARDRTLVLGDLDGDGDLDAVIGGLNQRVRVLRNDGSRGAWLIVAPATRPEGCRVEVRRGERVWRRWIISGAGYCSAAPPLAHFGLGDDDAPVDVTVIWADGTTATRTGVQPGRNISIERPTGR